MHSSGTAVASVGGGGGGGAGGGAQHLATRRMTSGPGSGGNASSVSSSKVDPKRKYISHSRGLLSGDLKYEFATASSFPVS